MILSERYDYLREFLVDLSAPGHCSTILDWYIAGNVYLEYINICLSMQQLSKVSSNPLLCIYAFMVWANIVDRDPCHLIENLRCSLLDSLRYFGPIYDSADPDQRAWMC
jgi:hypothetical protein